MNRRLAFWTLLGFLLLAPSVYAELDLQKLSDQDIQTVKAVLVKWEPLIQERKSAKNLSTLAFEDLYLKLEEGEVNFVKEFLAIDPVKAGIHTKWQGLAFGTEELVRIENQIIRKKDGASLALDPQFAPPEVFESYEKMMEAMQKDIGKKLLIESAYRSSAYQLYLFIFYLQNHNYSILETAVWNALPGYSEHGNPKRQALDFVNEEGVNGENNPEEFAALVEYDWLQKNAARFGFYLSYPKVNESGIGFEPWHWHYENTNQ